MISCLHLMDSDDDLFPKNSLIILDKCYEESELDKLIASIFDDDPSDLKNIGFWLDVGA